MAVEIVQCPHCQSKTMVKYGTDSNGKARIRCQQSENSGWTFIRAYAYSRLVPAVKRQMVEMMLNGSAGPAYVISKY